MRALILVAGAALAVSACSSNDDANNTMIVEDNMATDMNTMDMNAPMDANMTMNTDMNADMNMDMNGMNSMDNMAMNNGM